MASDRWICPSPWYQEIRGKECLITLSRRPLYCDRGNWIAKIVEATGALGLDLDGADGWPRYYFDEERAKLEVEAWLRKRQQIEETTDDRR